MQIIFDMINGRIFFSFHFLWVFFANTNSTHSYAVTKHILETKLNDYEL